MPRGWSTALVASVLLVGSAPSAEAQGTWDAMLTIQPFPSPYYSDWETNPNIGSLTVMNNTSSTGMIRIYFTVTDRMNRVVVSGRSEPETLGPGAVVVYDSPSRIAGSTTHDSEIERIASRTGRLPEGDYTACASVADDVGFVLDESCVDFFVAYPDPPLLLGPEDGARLADTEPLFQWTPAQVPMEYNVRYALRVVEVLPGQLPAEALRQNIPSYEERDAFTTSVRYPIDGLPLESGKTYAWDVRALDPNGYPASANDGRSEIWTFQVDEPEPVAPVSNAVVLNLVTVDPQTQPASNQLYGLSDVCELWDSIPSAISLPISVHPSFGSGVNADTATIYRDPQSRAWTILTQRSRLTYLMYGECDPGAGALSGLQWIAMRRSGTLGDLFDGVPMAPGPATELGLRYGMIILSLYPASTADVPQTFTAARDFLEGQDISLMTGVNAFGVVDLKQNGPLWAVLDGLGYSEKYVELQGFVGLDQSWSVGGRVGGTTSADGFPLQADTGGVELSAETTYLLLRGTLPERQPRVFTSLFETAQVGLELALKGEATTGIGAQRTDDGAAGGTDVAAALDLVLSATLTLTAHGGAVWNGSLGVDATQDLVHAEPGGETEETAPCWNEAVGECLKYVLKLGVSDIQVGGPIYLSGVEFELDINDGFINMVKTRDPGALDWGAVGTATLGVGELDDVGKIVLGIGRGADAVRADTTAGTTDVQRPTETIYVDENGAEPQAPVSGSEPVSRPRRDAQTDLERPTVVDEEGAAPQAPAPTGQPQSASPFGIKPGKWKWSARIALGNMSLPELLRLIVQNVND